MTEAPDRVRLHELFENPGGDLASTCIVKSWLRAEVSECLVKKAVNLVIANDNFALAA